MSESRRLPRAPAPPTATRNYMSDRVWGAIFSEGERLTRVKGTPEHLRVLPDAVREEEQPWVAARRIEDGRASLVRVEVDVVKQHKGGTTEIRPLGEEELEPGDEPTSGLRSSKRRSRPTRRPRAKRPRG